MDLTELYSKFLGDNPFIFLVSFILTMVVLGFQPWKKGLLWRIVGIVFNICSVVIWIVILRSIWLYADSYLEVGFSWSCGTAILLFLLIIPFAPLMNINIHFMTMIEERGAKYAIKNWKLPILLGIEQTKRFFVEVAYEGEEDPEERKRKREEAKEAAKEKAEKEKRQEERDRHFLLGEEEQV